MEITMGAPERFRVNSPAVAWEDFGDEVIIVNLESGSYYSTREAGAEIWRRIAGGVLLSVLEPELLALYDVEAAGLTASLAAFVASLQEQGLIVATTAGDAVPGALTTAAGAKRAFAPPALESYSDMQDLLLLDPIHEVDDSGWPNPK